MVGLDPGLWRLDRPHSSMTFSCPFMGITRMRGIEQRACDRLREATTASSTGSRVADLLRASKGRYT